MSADVLFSEAELVRLTDYELPGRQVEVLHKAGFWRARISARTGRVVLERAHYEAVCSGQAGTPERKPQLRSPTTNRRAGVRREEEPGTAAAGVPARPLVSADGRARKQARPSQPLADR